MAEKAAEKWEGRNFKRWSNIGPMDGSASRANLDSSASIGRRKLPVIDLRKRYLGKGGRESKLPRTLQTGSGKFVGTLNGRKEDCTRQ